MMKYKASTSTFFTFFMALDVVLGAKIVKVSVLICLDVGKGLVGLFSVSVGLGIHAVGLAIKVDGLSLFDCFARLSTGAFESGGNKSSHSLCVFWLRAPEGAFVQLGLVS
jgi:hypothetical protein